MAIVFKNTDITRWGSGKGAPLSSLEADLNLWQLEARIGTLETSPVQPNEINIIEVIGNQLYIHMTDYTTFGPFTLPTAAFNFTGNFQALHAYKANDFLIANDSLLLVNHDFTSGAAFVFGSDDNGPFYTTVMPFPTLFSVGLFFPGKPGFGIEVDDYEASALFSYRADRSFFFKAGLASSIGGLLIDATADMVFDIMKNLDKIGEVHIAAASNACTFVFADDVQFVANDVLRVLRPFVLDTTAKDLTVTFQGRLGTL